MGKVKSKRKLKLVPAYVLLAVLFLLGAMGIADFERGYIEKRQMLIASKYTDSVETFNDYKVWDEDGNVYVMSQSDSRKIKKLDLYAYIFPHMAYICSTFLAGLVYYKRKLKLPLRILKSGAERIANNDLNFQINYDVDDEFGHLCQAFEKMRSTLEESSKETWRQMEERKRLNASFSHDLRTPLTVLEGHLDILQKYSENGALSEEDISEIYSVMDIQLKRLIRYVSSMSKLQSLEDIPLSPKLTDTQELLKTIKNTADIICAGKKMHFVSDIHEPDVAVDIEIVLQVFENLMSNAARYAKSEVSVTCKTLNNHLLITVSDDGCGFDVKDIKIATDPFYTTEKKSEGEHFGLGLNICKILCQRHGGGINLKNNKFGGASITAYFSS